MQHTILVIDDETDILDVMSVLLTQEGYLSLFAESGYVALEHLRSGEWTPDLIVVDERMPVMTGDVFIRQLEQEGLRTMPIVIFSASWNIPTLCEEVHAEGCLLKPFELTDLFKLLKKLLKAKKS